MSSFLWYAEGSFQFYLAFPSDVIFIDASDIPWYFAVHLHRKIKFSLLFLVYSGILHGLLLPGFTASGFPLLSTGCQLGVWLIKLEVTFMHICNLVEQNGIHQILVIYILPVMSTCTKLEKVINISMSGKWYHDVIVGAESWLIKRNLRLCAAFFPPKTGCKTTSFLCLAELHGKMGGEYVMFKLTRLLPSVTGSSSFLFHCF